MYVGTKAYGCKYTYIHTDIHTDIHTYIHAVTVLARCPAIECLDPLGGLANAPWKGTWGLLTVGTVAEFYVWSGCR